MNNHLNIKKNSNKMIVTLQYDGGGWTFPYLAGVTKRIQDLEDNCTVANRICFKYAGISSGACVALAAALDIPMDDLMDLAMPWVPWCRAFPWCTGMAVKRITQQILTRYEITTQEIQNMDNFAVGLSEYDGTIKKYKGIVMSSFSSHNDLTSIMTECCNIPYVNAFALKPCRYYDGGFTQRFFKVPWDSDFNIKLSSCKSRNEATYRCALNIPKYRAIIPYKRVKLLELYELGYKDGETICADICLKM